MKINELERCLSRKLQLDQKAVPRYTDYQLKLKGKIVGLPTLLRISHGSGDSANRNLGNVAKGLGLNAHTLKETVRCRIGRACVLLCLSAKLLKFVHEQRRDLGEVFRPGVLAMLESIELVLTEPEFAQSLSWNAVERSALDHWLATVEGLGLDKECGAVARKLIERMSVK